MRVVSQLVAFTENSRVLSAHFESAFFRYNKIYSYFEAFWGHLYMYRNKFLCMRLINSYLAFYYLTFSLFSMTTLSQLGIVLAGEDCKFH